MSEDVNKVESSATVVAEPEFNPADQNTWSPEQREHWNATGEQPAPPKKQESAPAEPPAKEAKSAAAESETAPKQGKKDRKPGEKLSAEERISQLTAKNKELETELERSRAAATKPPETKTETKAEETPKRPSPFNWQGTKEEYEAAMEKWEAHQRAEVIAQFQRDAAAQANIQRLNQQIDEVVAKYPDTTRKQLGEVAGAFNEAALPGVIKQMLYDTEVLPELMYLFSDKETRDNFIEQANKNPGKAIRALALMEADVKAKLTAKPDAEKSESKVPAETKPRAPKPPSEVGGRGTTGEDALRTAAAAGDFSSFEAEESRRKFAKVN